MNGMNLIGDPETEDPRQRLIKIELYILDQANADAESYLADLVNKLDPLKAQAQERMIHWRDDHELNEDDLPMSAFRKFFPEVRLVKLGRPIEIIEPKKNVAFTLTLRQIYLLKNEANKRGISLSALVRKILDQELCK